MEDHDEMGALSQEAALGWGRHKRRFLLLATPGGTLSWAKPGSRQAKDYLSRRGFKVLVSIRKPWGSPSVYDAAYKWAIRTYEL